MICVDYKALYYLRLGAERFLGSADHGLIQGV